MTSSQPELSIIIPTYMEAGGIADTLEQLSKFLATRSYGEVEILVVDASSPDGTAKIAENAGRLFKNFRLIQAGPRMGKGHQVRLGMFEARGRYRLFMDADLATPLEHLDEVYLHMERGDRVIIAVRDLLTIHHGFLRKVMSGAGNIFGQLVLLPGIIDTQCGFKAFEAEAAEAIFGRQTMIGWSFDFEILKIARLLGYKIITIKAPDWHDPKVANLGLVGDSALHAAIKTLLDVITIRLKVWSGQYRQPNYTHKAMY